MKKLLVLSFTLTLALSQLFAQTKTFSESKTVFVSEAKNLLLTTDRTQGKYYADKLDSLLKVNALNDETTKIAAGFFNKMTAKRCRTYPHFSSYLEVMFTLINTGKIGMFEQFTQSAEHVLSAKSITTLGNYLEAINLYFKSSIINKTQILEWFTRYGGTQFVFEKGKDPYVVFTNVDLVCLSRKDSSVIKNTDGVWNILENTWTGKKGKVTWERTGLPSSAVFAELKDYKIQLKSAEYKADSVEFTHIGFFKGTLLGHLEEKILATTTEDRVLYPRFSSYEKRVKLDKLVDGVRYEGGFNIRGNRFMGIGDIENPAYIFIDREEKPFISMAALSWSFKENQIIGERVATSIYLYGEGNTVDSIYHPGCQVKYFTDKKELILSRMGDGVNRSKFSNTYQNLDFDPDALTWRVKEDKILFSQALGSSSDSATFFSDNYFRQRLYDRLAGFGDPDPLRLILMYCEKNDTRTFTIQEMAKFFKDDVNDIRLLLTRLSIEGFVNYNSDNERAEVKQRFLNFIGARYGKNDYDVIEIGSKAVKPYGFLSLLDNRMEVFGVTRIPMSDSQRVVLYPENQHVVIKRDLDMSFNGGVVGGQFTFLGKKYDFDYKLFKISMPTVDTILLRVRRLLPDEFGQYPPIVLKTPIESVSGFLEIDHPDGKSGLKAISTYPIFTSTKPSYTYYSQKYVEGGVYPRETFFFQIDPYVLDSLDIFNPRRLALPGTFTSAGIFPDIREELNVMPDYSLGFSGETGKAGLPAYGGPAKFFNKLYLSNQGLRGKGVLEYLNSKTKGEDFRFYPDSMNAWAQGYTIEANAKTPDVSGDSVYIHWEPKKGVYDVKNLGKPFDMYKGSVKLNGHVALKADGSLGGGGVVDIGNGIVKAKKINFSPKKFNSDSADFQLKNLNADDIDTNGIAFSTTNMKTEINFEEQKGKFEANDANAFVDFPVNQYKAFSDKVDWHMKTNYVELKANKGNTDGFKFLSYNKDTDSLEFRAQTALFKPNEKRIESEGVKYIDVADSRVMTKDGKVNILRRADLEPLKGAEIQMPTGVQHHLIKNADVDILGKYAIGGTGEYFYKDKTGREQIIKISKIHVDEKRQMTAQGIIEPEDSLKLMPHVLFKGEFNLYAQNAEPEINGFVTMEHDCILFGKRWMRTKGFISEGDIAIPVPEDAKDDKQTPIFNGFAFANDSSGIYPVLMASKKFHSDYEALSIHGFLKYDANLGEYRVASKEKLENPDLIENYVAFNPRQCSAYGEGPLELTGKLGQVSVNTAGVIKFLPQDTITEVEGVIGIDFKMDNALWKYLADRYKSYNESAPDFTEGQTMKNLLYLLKPAERARFKDRAENGKLDKMPGVLGSSIFFTEVTLTWNKKKRSLMYGGPANLLTMNGNLFDNGVTVYIEVIRKKSAEGVNFLIEFGDGSMYYFSYRNNTMQIFSTDNEFNKLFTGLDGKQRVFESKDLPTYQTVLGTQRRLDQFKAQFE